MALYFTLVSLDIPVVIEAEDENHAWEIARDDIRVILENENLDRLVKIHVVRERFPRLRNYPKIGMIAASHMVGMVIPGLPRFLIALRWMGGIRPLHERTEPRLCAVNRSAG